MVDSEQTSRKISQKCTIELGGVTEQLDLSVESLHRWICKKPANQILWPNIDKSLKACSYC